MIFSFPFLTYIKMAAFDFITTYEYREKVVETMGRHFILFRLSFNNILNLAEEIDCFFCILDIFNISCGQTYLFQ